MTRHWFVGSWIGLLILILPASARASIDQGDEAFRARENPKKAQHALELYRKAALDTNRQDPEALWRLSMGCYFVGLRLTQSKTDREKIFWEGQEAGKAAVTLDPHC